MPSDTAMPPLQHLLRPTAVAVIGASPDSMAQVTVNNLRQAGYAGPIYPVHPRRTDAFGLPCYPSVSALPGPVDCAVVAVNRQNSVAVIRELAAVGIRAAIIFASGFVEGGAEGRALQRELVEVAHDAGIAVCGPNCMGLLHVPSHALLTGYHVPPFLEPGPVSAIMQSGSVFYTVLHNTRGVRFNYVISSGNEAVTDLCYYLEAVLADPQTRVVALFVEGFRRPQRFLELVARAHAQEVPILVLKVGRSASSTRFALAHTGALAGSDAVFDAVCGARGILRVRDIDELLEAAGAFATGMRLPRGSGVAAVMDSGGERGLMVDLAEDVGVSFPPLSPIIAEGLAHLLPYPDSIANPIDAWGVGDAGTVYPQCLRLLAQDPAIDVVALATDTVIGSPEAVVYADSVIAVAPDCDKTMVLLSNSSREQDEPSVARVLAHGIPVLRGTETGLRVIKQMITLGRFRSSTPPQHRSPLAPAALSHLRAELQARRQRGELVLDEHLSGQILSRYGIPIARHILAHGRVEALAAFAQLQPTPAPRDPSFPTVQETAPPNTIKAHSATPAPPPALLVPPSGSKVVDASPVKVVLKVCSPTLPHKTEAGAVVLGLDSAHEVGAAYDQLAQRFPALHTEQGLPVLVQEMVHDGMETIIGLTRDPQWGLVLAFGLGGVLVELLMDVRLTLPPLDDVRANDLVHSISAARLLHGYRGSLPRDIRAIRTAMLSLSALAMDLDDLIEEVDVNPLLALPEQRGVCAVDALVRLRAL